MTVTMAKITRTKYNGARKFDANETNISLVHCMLYQVVLILKRNFWRELLRFDALSYVMANCVQQAELCTLTNYRVFPTLYIDRTVYVTARDISKSFLTISYRVIT